MKTIILTLIMTLFCGAFATVDAQKVQSLKVRVGEQKKFTGSKINVKFISLVEDSRCPAGVNCVWAGNAKIKVQISEGKNAGETFEINTNIGAKGATFSSYAVNLIELTPAPQADSKTAANSYTATFSIVRLAR